VIALPHRALQRGRDVAGIVARATPRLARPRSRRELPALELPDQALQRKGDHLIHRSGRQGVTHQRLGVAQRLDRLLADAQAQLVALLCDR